MTAGMTDAVLERSEHGAFHRLPVTALERLTDDAVAITLGIPERLRGAYRYLAGQHLTIRHLSGGQELRRSYSICLPPPVDGPPRVLRVAVKRLGEGGFGEYAATRLAVGDELTVMTPAGRFRLRDERPGDHHVAIAAGSGITPVLSILVAVLRDDPEARVTLLYGNRTTASVMFLEELADLKDRYPSRFGMAHVLSREDRGVPLLSGRLDARRLSTLLAAAGVSGGEDEQFYVCGPIGLVTTVRAVLASRGVPPRQVHSELFGVGSLDAPDRRPAPDAGTRPSPENTGQVALTVRLHGTTTSCAMTPGDESVLAAVSRARPEVPYSCTGGVCGTCRARLLAGTVTMRRDYALEPEEKEAGYVLACQSVPTSAELSLDFDA